MTQTQLLFTLLETWGGFFCIIGGVSVSFARKFGRKGTGPIIAILFLAAALLFSDAFAWTFERDADELVWIFYIADFLAIGLPYVLYCLAINYLDSFIRSRDMIQKVNIRLAADVILVIGITLLIISFFNGMYFSYEEKALYVVGPYIGLHLILCLLSNVIVTVFIIKNRKAFHLWEQLALFTIVIIISAAYLYEIVKKTGFSLSNMAIGFAMIIIMGMYSIDYAMSMSRQREELAMAKLQISLRQIQPHFMLNSLTCIKQACDENDPETAGRLVEEFAEFLKGSLSATSTTECISMTREMKTVRSYMEIIKDRFEGDVDVVYDLEDTGFSVPPFSVQMLVENAVKHGIRKKHDGKGTVTIHSYHTGGEYIVEISDDGVGFDPDKVTAKKEGQIGLQNVDTRLRIMCGGRLEIRSSVGNPTVAIMHIPDKREGRNAVFNSR